MSVEKLLRFLLGRPDPVPVLSLGEIRSLSIAGRRPRSIVESGGQLFALGDAPALDVAPTMGVEWQAPTREFLGLPFLRVGEPDPRLESMLRDLA